ncbi:MAG: two-component regulator propeller domain-containing protein [Elusimicrobiota bacterium]
MHFKKIFPNILYFSVILIFIITHPGYSLWVTYNTSNSGLKDEYIKTIFIKENNKYWIGTDAGGVSLFDGNNWTSYTSANSELLSDKVYCVAVGTSGIKWFGTDEGASSFDGVKWASFTEPMLKNNRVYDIAIDSSGVKWFGVLDGGVNRFDGHNWSSYITTVTVKCIAIDKEGIKWFGTNGNGIYKYDEYNGGLWSNYDTSDFLSAKIESIVADEQGNIWVGTYDGVGKFDGSEWTCYTTSNSDLPGSTVFAVAIDRNNNIWFGTNQGAARLKNKDWRIYNSENSGLVSSSIQSIAVDNNGAVWFGTVKGLNKYVIRPVEVEETEVRIQGGLEGYINPSKQETAKIYFKAASSGLVKIKIFDIRGNLVWKDEKTTDGKRDYIEWQGNNYLSEIVSSGVYLVSVQGPGIDSIAKIAVLR